MSGPALAPTVDFIGLVLCFSIIVWMLEVG